MPVLKVYVDEYGRSPFTKWFDAIAAEAAAKVTAHMARLAAGNLSNVRSVGNGVHEKKIDWGPGLRVYFGTDGGDIIILLVGSEKRDQAVAIRKAKEYWNDYKTRKR